MTLSYYYINHYCFINLYLCELGGQKRPYLVQQINGVDEENIHCIYLKLLCLN